MKKVTKRSPREPSKASLREIPEVDFTKSPPRKNRYAKRIAAEGITVQVGRGRPKKIREVGGTPDPAALREFAVQYSCEAVAAGRSVRAAAKELGVSDPTLRNWTKALGRKAPVPSVAAFREVVVEPEPQAAKELVVTTASGLRIEGLDLADVLALVRAQG